MKGKKTEKKTNKKAVDLEQSSEIGSASPDVSDADGSSVDLESDGGTNDVECSDGSSSREAEIEEETSSGSSEEEAKENSSLTVFLKGLNYDLTEDDLRNEMEKIGKVVRVGIPMTNDKRRNKGFGYVEFSREEDVKKVLKLDKTMFLGREVFVDMANPRSDKKRYTIYVSNIPFECDKKKLRQYFEEMGKVIGMSLPYDKDNDRLRGFGFVDYAEKDEYEAVLTKKLVFENSQLYQRPADKNGKESSNRGFGNNDSRGGFRNNNSRDGFRNNNSRDGYRNNDSRGGFRRNDDFKGRNDGKRHGSDTQNKSNKKIKFDSDEE